MDVLARRAAASEHVVGVVDEPPVLRVRGAEFDAVLLGYAESGTLETLLADRRGVRGGEAATILLGVAAGIRSLHEAGWSAPELTPASVVFVGDGCPALDALDQVVEWTPSSAVVDAEAFYRLARSLCLQVADGTGMTLLSSVETGLRHGTWSAVEESILRTVAPEAVRLSGASSSGDSAGVKPAVGAAPARSPEVSAPRGRGRGAGVGGRLGSMLGSAMDALDDSPGRVLVRWLRGRVRRRPALVVIGLVPVAAALALIVLLPASPAESASAVGSSSPARGSSIVEEARRGTASPTPAGTGLPVASAPATTKAQPAKTEAGATAMVGDDPVDAARALLDARLVCFRARTASPACLEDVLDGTSALMDEESGALGVTGARASRDYSGARLSLVESWGGAALVSVVPDAARSPKSEPASLLLVRSEAGWRLRAVFP
ncbi:MAG: hypothetical protein JF618_04925 [Leifsonia sp.]|nr:hypothetical protein [Leifsonia sp.]